MKKPSISAREVLEDIRSGVDDIALMKKYELSAKGLQSLFTKLGEAGIIKHLNAHEVMADLRSGISSDGLMKKYKLTAQGLQNLFQELDRAGLLRGSAEHNDVPAKVVIDIDLMVKDIRSGLTKTQLMRKYHLSDRGLRWISMTLISSGSIAWQEVYDNLCISYQELVPDKPRQRKRHPLPFECPVYVVDNPGVVGKVRDIAEKGLGILGISANAGETKTLVIHKHEFGEFAGFTFDAVCRWTTKGPKGLVGAGFEICHISIGNLKEFRLLLHLAQFGSRDKAFPSSRPHLFKTRVSYVGD